MNEELKPCPFCGGLANLSRGYISSKCVKYQEVYTPKCIECEAIIDIDFDTKEEAITEWNTRKLDDVKDKRIKILETALGDIAYCKTHTIQNNPHALVSIALQALEKGNDNEY